MFSAKITVAKNIALQNISNHGMTDTTCLVFDDMIGLRIGAITTDIETLAKKSPFLNSLWENAPRKDEVNVPINNFENQKDIVGFLTNVFYTNYVLKNNGLNLDWLEYAIYFQIDDIVKEYIKHAIQHNNTVLTFYEETYTLSSYSGSPMYTKKVSPSYQLPENDLKMFWKLINMSYKYEVMKDLHSVPQVTRLMQCPLLIKNVEELVVVLKSA